MAGNEDGQRVVGHGAADGAGAAAGGGGEFGIGAGLAGGDVDQGLPDSFAVGGAVGGQGEGEGGAFAVEIVLQLVAGFGEERGDALVSTPAPVEGDEVAVLFGEGDVADGCVQGELGQAGIRVVVAAPGSRRGLQDDRSAASPGCQACPIRWELHSGAGQPRGVACIVWFGALEAGGV